MGSTLSLLWPSQDDNAVDPATGLTGKQKKLVQSTWAVVMKDPVASGVAVILAFLKKHPQYQDEFAAFKDVPFDQLPENKRFQAHCSYVITALNNVVESMNDFELMEASLVSLGERHKKRGQTKEQFNNLKQVFIEILRQKLGSDFTPEVAEAWTKTFDLLYQSIFKAYAA